MVVGGYDVGYGGFQALVGFCAFFGGAYLVVRTENTKKRVMIDIGMVNRTRYICMRIAAPQWCLMSGGQTRLLLLYVRVLCVYDSSTTKLPSGLRAGKNKRKRVNKQRTKRRQE